MQFSRMQKSINFIALFSVFFLQNIDNYIRSIGNHIKLFNSLKNVLLLAITIYFLFQIYYLYKNNHNIIFIDELKDILKLAGIFLLISIYFMIKNHGFNFVTLDGVLRIILPIIIAFAVLNVMEFKEIYMLMVGFLILSVSMYLYSIGFENLTLENFMKIDFIHSYSIFESNMFSVSAVALCCFFCYFRNIKFYTILSVVFTIMTFKRFMILFAIFMLLTGGIFKKLYEVPKIIILLSKIGMLILSFLYIRLMLGEFSRLIEKLLGMSVNEFSMGRSWLMQRIVNSDFKSTGMNTTQIQARSMEMDIPQFYIELSIISIIALIHYFINIAKRNWYNFILIIFCMIELLTSHFLDIMYFWMILYITIGCISYKTNKKQNFKKGNSIKLVIKYGAKRLIE